GVRRHLVQATGRAYGDAGRDARGPSGPAAPLPAGGLGRLLGRLRGPGGRRRRRRLLGRPYASVARGRPPPRGRGAPARLRRQRLPTCAPAPLMTVSSLCAFLQTGAGAYVSDAFWNHSSFSDSHADVSKLNRITYAYIAPVIIACGIIGDILTVATLTHPLLRQSSIVYTYLTLLAMTDLLTHLSVIPMIMWLLDIRLCSRASAFYYAHVGFPLANALMGASVWIVVFLTLSQYMAVCHPFHYGALKKRRCCFGLFAIAYFVNFLIHAPWASKKNVHSVPAGVQSCEFVVCDRQTEPWYVAYEWSCEFVVCDRQTEPWYVAYEWVREMITRVFPFLIVAYLNVRILITYRNTKRDRIRRLTSANSQRKFTMEKSEKEEKRLFILLFAIIIVFFLCTIPAAPLTVFVADKRSQNLPFQIIRAVVNLLEFTKFALNFYFYCLINPDIRRISLHIVRCRKLIRPARVKGQPVNPLSLYTRSTKSVRTKKGEEGAASLVVDDYRRPRLCRKLAFSEAPQRKGRSELKGQLVAATGIRLGAQRREEGGSEAKMIDGRRCRDDFWFRVGCVPGFMGTLAKTRRSRLGCNWKDPRLWEIRD
uniref:G_PROTEIN_RECEP_F1_2 domain-containing protein n=1 Tax=Steinernema glaseri TaxID=37863 RepID=A0A1I7ZJP2_9BILA